MTDYCVDACSLINLYCGWGGMRELHDFGTSWSTSQTAVGEFTEVRELADDGSLRLRRIDVAEICGGSPLVVLSVTGDEETRTLARLATVIDDGEAECLAIAKHRGLTLVSDDGLAVIQAREEGVPVVSSLELLMQWSAADAARDARLAKIARRIEVLARYTPAQTHPYRGWWDRLEAR